MQGPPARAARCNVLGVNVSAVTMADVIERMGDWIEQRRPNYVCVTPAHGVMDCLGDPNLRGIFNRSGLTTPDGMAIVWLMKLRGLRRVERVYGPDLLLAACARSLERGWSHYFYGGAPGVAERLAERLGERFPGLRVAGACSPPFRPLTPEEDGAIVEQINAQNPDVVWVGISTPKQERWMAEHVGRLNAPVLLGVGAAFDFLAGVKRQAPRWMQRSGLEWLFRLASEPRRLWPRYRQYPRFAVLAIAQLLGLRQFPAE